MVSLVRVRPDDDVPAKQTGVVSRQELRRRPRSQAIDHRLRTTVLDQGELGHVNQSHHGWSRRDSDALLPCWGRDGLRPEGSSLRGLTDYVEAGARRIGLNPVPSDRRVGHLIGLRSSAAFPADLSKQLTDAGVYVSLRGSAIRVSPHLYNTREECDRLFAVLARVL